MKKQKWFWIALIAVLASAPNALLLKTVIDTYDPLLINALRFGLAAVVFLPYTVSNLYKLWKSSKWLLQGTAGLVAATVAYVYSIEFAPASYVSLFALVSPVVMVLLAQRLLRERITARAYAGITLAAGGAGLMCLLPFVSSSQLQVYPVATLLCLVSVVSFPLSVIRFKQVHKKSRVPLQAVVGFSSVIVAAISLFGWLVTASDTSPAISTIDWISISYSGIMVLGLWRVLLLHSYDFVSTPVLGVLTYFEGFVAIVLAVVLLQEIFTWQMWTGGALIVLGVFVVEYHRYSHKRRPSLLIPHKILQLMK